MDIMDIIPDSMIDFHSMKSLRLDFTSGKMLTAQLADALRRQIADGTLARGAKLPAMSALAATCGVSLNVVRRALALLTAEGLVSPRRNAGTTVVGRVPRPRVSRILFIVPDGNWSFYMTTLFSVSQATLAQAGCEPATLALPFGKSGHIDFSPLKRIPRGRYDLALAFAEASAVADLLQKIRLPFVTFGGLSSTGVGNRGAIQFLPKAGTEDFIADCRRKRPKSVLQLVKENSRTEPDAIRLLHKFGIKATTLLAPRIVDSHVPSDAEYSALVALKAYLDRGKSLPELLFLTDDYMAAGAITALLLAGKRIPQDVKVVTFSVKGNGPVLDLPLTRIEMDPFEDAKKLARCLLDLAAGRHLPKDCVLRSSYIPGQTF